MRKRLDVEAEPTIVAELWTPIKVLLGLRYEAGRAPESTTDLALPLAVHRRLRERSRRFARRRAGGLRRLQLYVGVCPVAGFANFWHAVHDPGERPIRAV